LVGWFGQKGEALGAERMAGRGRGRTVPAWMQKGGDGDSSTMSLPTAAPSAPNPSREPVRGMDGDGLAPGWAEAVAHDGRKVGMRTLEHFQNKL